jgi:DNA-directed RNA polymerase subunit RPC12/RpoP
MSYQLYQMECLKCKEKWNTSFGIVGKTQVASPTIECPYCNSPRIKKVADGWYDENNKKVI